MSRVLGRSYLTPHIQPHVILLLLFVVILVPALTVDRTRSGSTLIGGSMFLEN
jgi:hypothetical protein